MKRFLSVLIALVMLLLCVSCAGPGDVDATKTPPLNPTVEPDDSGDSNTVDENDPYDVLEDVVGYQSSDILGDLELPGNVPPSKLPLSDGKTISVWSTGLYPSTGMVDWNDSNVWKELSRRLGVNFEFYMGAFTDASAAFVLHIMGEDFADIMSNTVYYIGGIDKAVDDGVFIDLVNYVDYIPHYMALVNSSETSRNDAFTDGSHMGHFCNITYSLTPLTINGMTMRYDMFQKAGWNNDVLPETFDEWENMLIHFRDNMDLPGALYIDAGGVESFNSAMLRGLGLTNKFILDDGKVSYSLIQPEFKTYLTYMNSWYEQNLIYQEYYSQNPGIGMGAMLSMCAAEDSLLIVNNFTAYAGSYYYDAGVAINPEFFLVALKDPVLNKGDRVMGTGSSESVRFTSGNGWAVTTEAEDPILCMRMLDYMYSSEGAHMAAYGTIPASSVTDTSGTYFYNEDGRPMLTELIFRNPDGLDMGNSCQIYAMHTGAPLMLWDRETDTYNEDMLATAATWGDTDPVVNGHQILPSNYSTTADEGAEASRLLGDIQTYVTERVTNFILGNESLDTYDDYVARVKQMGIDDVCSIYQTAVNRYYARGN